MIEDLFIEKSIARENSKSKFVKTTLCIALTIFFLLFVYVFEILFFGTQLIFVAGVISFFAVFLCIKIVKSLSAEYEVSITNDLFNLSKILSKSRREDLVEFTIGECEKIAPLTSDSFNEYFGKAQIKMNATAKRKFIVSDMNWFCYLEISHTRVIVIFEMDPRMYKAFRRYNPRNTEVVRIDDIFKDN